MEEVTADESDEAKALVQNLLDSLLTRSTPESLRKHMARQKEGTYPRSFGVEGGYPSENKVEEIGMIAWADAERWLREEFPHLWRSVRGGAKIQETTGVGGNPALEIHVTTGGWSGCEEVIDAVLRHAALAHHCRKRTWGGSYTFVVPHREKPDG